MDEVRVAQVRCRPCAGNPMTRVEFENNVIDKGYFCRQCKTVVDIVFAPPRIEPAAGGGPREAA